MGNLAKITEPTVTDAVSTVNAPSTAKHRFTMTGCFSPEAMLITMAIEFVGAIYLALRYRLNKVTWLAIGVLVFLGIFQMAEFLICSFSGIPGVSWARVGYMSITMLPPLGISLTMAIAGKKALWAQIVLYATCAAFVGWFGFSGLGLTGEQCEGNYVIFAANETGMWLFGTYYYVYLAIGTFLGFYWAAKTENKRTARSLRWLAVGYLVFILPTILVALLDPASRDAIPSVMCGFAVFLAITILLAVMPYGGTRRGPDNGDSADLPEGDQQSVSSAV